MREDRPIPELLRADHTYLNERLARHYGVDRVHGSHLRRVKLSDERRMGLLGHGSVLTATSYPDRTSVVLRGKWILENLLGSPPPPPNVPPLAGNARARHVPSARSTRTFGRRPELRDRALRGRAQALGAAVRGEHVAATDRLGPSAMNPSTLPPANVSALSAA